MLNDVFVFLTTSGIGHTSFSRVHYCRFLLWLLSPHHVPAPFRPLMQPEKKSLNALKSLKSPKAHTRQKIRRKRRDRTKWRCKTRRLGLPRSCFGGPEVTKGWWKSLDLHAMVMNSWPLSIKAFLFLSHVLISTFGAWSANSQLPIGVCWAFHSQKIFLRRRYVGPKMVLARAKRVKQNAGFRVVPDLWLLQNLAT